MFSAADLANNLHHSSDATRIVYEQLIDDVTDLSPIEGLQMQSLQDVFLQLLGAVANKMPHCQHHRQAADLNPGLWSPSFSE